MSVTCALCVMLTVFLEQNTEVLICLKQFIDTFPKYFDRVYHRYFKVGLTPAGLEAVHLCERASI